MNIPREISIIKRISVHEFADVIYQLGVFLGAGITQLEAVQIIKAGQETHEPRKRLGLVEDSLKKGENLADSLSHYHRWFKPFMVEMVRSASPQELPGVLKSIGEFLEAIHIDNKGMKFSDLIYPLMVIGIAVITVCVLLVFVVPIFEGIFGDFGRSLPAPTLILIKVSRFLRDNLLYIIFGGVALLLGLRYIDRKIPMVYKVRSKLIRHVPLWGKLYVLAPSYVFVRTVAFILENGRSMTTALEAAAQTMKGLHYQQAVKRIKEDMFQGKTFAAALTDADVFSLQMTSVAMVADASPEALLSLLIRLGDSYHKQTQDIAKNLRSISGTMLTVVLGGVVGFIVIAMYLPIFQLARIG